MSNKPNAAITNGNGECNCDDVSAPAPAVPQTNEHASTCTLRGDGLFLKMRLNSITSIDNPDTPQVTHNAQIETPPIKRNISDGNLLPTEVKEARVRVIYTGGTIGMVRNENNGKNSRYCHTQYVFLTFPSSTICSFSAHSQCLGENATPIS